MLIKSNKPTMRFQTETLQQSAPLLLPPPRPKMIGNSRSGRWTDKEEKFARYIIQCYAAGLLQLDHGVTLRSYLSKKLRCLPSRITKKFKGNDDSNIQGAQRLQKDSSNVSPCDVQLAQQNLQALEKEFLQELTAAARSEVANSQNAHPRLVGQWQPELSVCDPAASADTTVSSPPRQRNTYDASRDQLLNMSLGLNSILGSLLQRACSENHAIVQQQQTAETMNALAGAFTSSQTLSVPVTPSSCTSSPLTPPVQNFSNIWLSPNPPRLPISSTHVAPPTIIDNWATASTGKLNGSMQYGSTHPSQLARELTKKLSNSPRKSILPRPGMRFQPEHIQHAPTMSIQPANEFNKNESSSPSRRKKPKTPPVQHVDDPLDTHISTLPRQPTEMEDADVFLSFVQSVNSRSPNIKTN